MIDREQLEVWVLELSNFFVRQHKYQVITLNQETQEVWLINKDHPVYPIVLLSAHRLEDIDTDAIRAQRRALSLLFKCDQGGINISVNPQSHEVSSENVMVGIGSVSDVSLLVHYPGLDMILTTSTNFSLAKNRAVQALNKSMKKLQKMSNLKKNKVTTTLTLLMIFVYAAVSVFSVVFEIQGTTALVMFGAYTKPMVSLAQEWWRFITPMFLHADIIHLLMNMLAFRNIATMVEPELGWKRYLLVMVSGVFFGSAFTYIQGANVIAVGASAGIYALLGVLLVMMYERELFKNKMVLRQVVNIMTLNLLLSLMPGVSFMGHLGGFYIGIFFGFAFSKRKDWEFIRNFSKGMTLASFILIFVVIYTSNIGVLPSQVEVDVVRQWDALGFKGYAERLFRLLFK